MSVSVLLAEFIGNCKIKCKNWLSDIPRITAKLKRTLPSHKMEEFNHDNHPDIEKSGNIEC